MVVASGYDSASGEHAGVARGQESPMSPSIPIKRVFLHTVIATLVLAALVGIYVFLFGSFGRTEAKIRRPMNGTYP